MLKMIIVTQHENSYVYLQCEILNKSVVEIYVQVFVNNSLLNMISSTMYSEFVTLPNLLSSLLINRALQRYGA